MLEAGTPAPDFELPSALDHTQKLSDLRGKRVVLAFYPNDWSPVCSDQLALYSQALPLFEKHNAQLLGLSVDSRFCHQAFVDDRHLHFPLLADFEPKGAVAKRYDVYDEAGGTSQRALFVLDEQGVIRWAYVSPNEVNPGADGILEALEKLDGDGGQP
ncbi:redoxin domain-containing protein [Hymenobacter sp. RP-2-7]|uniref:Redoxin domain-containing protein n=1 Tax=Hymenobacter polaris TaxID=2682546 RepID=A0A7Y0FMA1_9BACT|nr:redoxin domain-containing protein [Hymenobacter polaris]NML65310.1 redoxin domain-containing protein [Hymenobacter polaris]